MKLKLSDFWKQTLSCTLGTVIGIILTFGTSAWIEYREKQETERTAALMVIHNLESFVQDLALMVKELQTIDEVNAKVLAAKDHLDTVSEDTLSMFVTGILSHNFNTIDETAETIFSSNIETWKSIGNSEFIELAGNCFSAKRLMVKFQERLEAEKDELSDMFLEKVTYSDHPTESLQETVATILRSSRCRRHIKKQGDFYLRGMEQGVKVLSEKTDQCKRLMNVTDEELKKFGYNE
jgi:hypothetical protein